MSNSFSSPLVAQEPPKLLAPLLNQKKKKKMGMERLRLQLLPFFEQTNFLSSCIQSHYDDDDGGGGDDEAWAKFSSSCDHRELILRQQQERCA
jgi:hypothetical protein